MTMKYKCKYCGRIVPQKCAHNCNTGFRKRHLEWVEVEDKVQQYSDNEIKNEKDIPKNRRP